MNYRNNTKPWHNLEVLLILPNTCNQTNVVLEVHLCINPVILYNSDASLCIIHLHLFNLIDTLLSALL